MSRHIVVAGSLNMDLVVRVPRHPKLGETLLGGSFGTFPGGKGANQAVAAARLGGTLAGAFIIGRSRMASISSKCPRSTSRWSKS